MIMVLLLVLLIIVLTQKNMGLDEDAFKTNIFTLVIRLQKAP